MIEFRSSGGTVVAVCLAEPEANPPEDVISNRGSNSDLRVRRVPTRLELTVLEFSGQIFHGHPVLEGKGREDSHRVHHATKCAAFLGDDEEHLTGAFIVIQANGDVSLVAADVELVGDGVSGVGQPPA